MSDKLKSLISSRRFWTAVVGVATVIAVDTFGMDEKSVQIIGGLFISWIVGDSLRKTE